jgi:hypothetical protein
MPTSPKGRCRVCHQLHCTDPAHKPKARGHSDRERGFDGEGRSVRDAIMRDHLDHYGWWCPGAPDLQHAPHPVKHGQLDVDHVNGNASDNAASNMRVLCRRVNRGAARGAARKFR